MVDSQDVIPEVVNGCKRNTPKLVWVEGLISSGKSTLVRQVKDLYANDPSVVFIEEPVELFSSQFNQNPLVLLQTDPHHYSTIIQVLFTKILSKFYKDLFENLPSYVRLVVSDRFLFSCEIFSRCLKSCGYLTEFDYQTVKAVMEDYSVGIQHPDLIFFLDRPLGWCLNHLGQRNRVGEVEFCTRNYMSQLQLAIEEYLRETDTKIVRCRPGCQNDATSCLSSVIDDMLGKSV